MQDRGSNKLQAQSSLGFKDASSTKGQERHSVTKAEQRFNVQGRFGRSRRRGTGLSTFPNKIDGQSRSRSAAQALFGRDFSSDA